MIFGFPNVQPVPFIWFPENLFPASILQVPVPAAPDGLETIATISVPKTPGE